MVADITTRKPPPAREIARDRGHSPGAGDRYRELPGIPAADHAPDTQFSAAPPEPGPLAGPFDRGQTVGEHYEITGLLGAGGMGVVYEAVDRLLDRSVALKVPRRPEFAETLRHEAQAMAAVRHPNLVTVHAAGREGDVEFVVMERVYGMTLEQRVDEAWSSGRPIPLDESLGFLVAIADGLSAIHGAGAAHRDVKSANVILSGQRVVLADFGLATPEVAVHPGAPIAGSADYMAPEVILGLVHPGQGPRVDLYALGVVAFEVLTGRRPYPYDTTHAVLLAHVSRPVPDLRERRGETPDDLAVLVGELMSKAPDERPESAEAVLWRLGAILGEVSRVPVIAPLSVLIVDDDPRIADVLRRSLLWALPRLAVETSADAADALARIQRKAPEVVVVDLNMPGTNGVELCMSLDAIPERARPVMVAMSGHASESDVALLRRLGVRAFVPKDEGFVPHLCEVIGAVRRASHGAPPPHRRSRPPMR
jgi:serine/threonine-protein kinase